MFFFSLYTGFAFAVLFLFFAAFPYVFTRPPYSFTPSQSGLTFIPIMIGVFLGCVTTIAVDRMIYQKKYRETIARGKSHVDPEHRLYTAMFGSWGMVIGLFWFGWCADQGVNWVPTVIGVIPFAWGNICVFVGCAKTRFRITFALTDLFLRHLLCCTLLMYMVRRTAHQL